MGPWRVLFAVWLVISTAGQIISFASLTEDIIAWHGFFAEYIDTYRRMRSAMFDPLFGWLRWPKIGWAQDYLTLHSLFAVSVAWAFFNIAGMGSFNSVASPLKFLFGNALDYSVASSSSLSKFEMVAYRAIDNLRAATPFRDSDATAAAALVQRLSRKTSSWGAVGEQTILVVMVIASIVCCSFALPGLLKAVDATKHRLSMDEFARRRGRMYDDPVPVAMVTEIAKFYDDMVETYEGSAGADEYFHLQIRDGILGHLGVTVILFMLVVMANQILVELM